MWCWEGTSKAGDGPAGPFMHSGLDLRYQYRVDRAILVQDRM
jgi:hypothetical protein